MKRMLSEDAWLASIGKHRGVAIRILDVFEEMLESKGGQDYGVAEEDLYYEKWIEEFGALCNTIHIQQTRRRGSDHAPFTPDTVGDVTIEGIVSALEHSVKNYEKNCLAKHVPLPENIYLVLEVIPSTSQSSAASMSSVLVLVNPRIVASRPSLAIVLTDSLSFSDTIGKPASI